MGIITIKNKIKIGGSISLNPYWTQQKINDSCLFFASHQTDLTIKNATDGYERRFIDNWTRTDKTQKIRLKNVTLTNPTSGESINVTDTAADYNLNDYACVDNIINASIPICNDMTIWNTLIANCPN